MKGKPEIVFTFPNVLGGVASFNRNIINHSKVKDQFFVRVVLLTERESSSPRFEEDIFADEVLNFDYSKKENQYFVCKRLNEYLGECPGAVVADNYLTFNTVALFPTQKTVFSLIHDYYYVRLTLSHLSVIDQAIAHSSFFRDILFAANSSIFSKRAHYIPYGVDQPMDVKEKKSDRLKLAFLGRLTKGKGVHLLRSIEEELEKENVPSNWTIVGRGPMKGLLRDQWNAKDNFQLLSPKTMEGVYEVLGKQDILVLPTFFEGTPVSILESISNGVVPVVSDLPGGIRDIVSDEIGFRCEVGEPKDFARAIIHLHRQRGKLKSLQQNCMRLGNLKYDITKAADRYFTFFAKFETLKNTSLTERRRPHFSRLDSKYFPNFIVYYLRSLR